MLKDVDPIFELTGTELQKRLYQYMNEADIKLADMEEYYSYYPDKLYRNLIETRVIYTAYLKQ